MFKVRCRLRRLLSFGCGGDACGGVGVARIGSLVNPVMAMPASSGVDSALRFPEQSVPIGL